jgi:MFS family permease
MALRYNHQKREISDTTNRRNTPIPVSEVEVNASRSLQRCYPWVVIAIAFLTVGVAFGTRNAFAVFLIAVIEEFHWSRALASGALMLGSVMWTMSAPLIGILLDRLGPRVIVSGGALIMAAGFVIAASANSALPFYLGMGVFMGVGFAALPMTVQATFLSNWFVRRRGMAIGAAASGIGVGILLVVPWTQQLIATYGWRAAMSILAAVLAFVVAPLNYFFQRQKPDEMNLKPDFGEVLPQNSETKARSAALNGPTLREALRTWHFWALAVGVFSGAIPLHLVLIHQVAAVNDAGLSRELAALGLGLIGLFTAPSMLFMGLLADRIGRQSSYLLGSLALMTGILLLMLITDQSRHWLLYVFPIFTAIGFSSRQSLYPTIAADLFHGKAFGAIIGAISLFIGAGAGIGPWLGGVIHDWTGSYYWAFWVAQALALISVAFIRMAGPERQRYIG